MLTRCPDCRSPRVIVVVSAPRRAFCTACSSRWSMDPTGPAGTRAPSLSANAESATNTTPQAG